MAGGIGFRHVLGVVVVLFTSALLVASKAFIPEMTISDTRIPLIGIIVVAFIAMATMAYHYKDKYRKHHEVLGTSIQARTSHPTDTIEDLLEEYALPVAIFIFGSGAIYLQFINVLTDVQCMGYYLHSAANSSTANMEDPRKEVTTRLVFSLIKVLYFSIKLPFLTKLHQLKHLKEKFWQHHCVLLIIGTDISIWIYTFFRDSSIVELDKAVRGQSDPVDMGLTLEQACTNMSTVLIGYVKQDLNVVFVPFTMEYLLASLEILFHTWLLAREPLNHLTPNRDSALTSTSNTDVEPRFEFPTPPDSDGSNSSQTDIRQVMYDSDESQYHQRSLSETRQRSGRLMSEAEEPLTQSSHTDVHVLTKALQLPHPESSPDIVQWGCCQRLYKGALRIFCNAYIAIMLGIIEIAFIKASTLDAEAAHFNRTGISQSGYMSGETYLNTRQAPTNLFRVFCYLPAAIATIHCVWVLSSSKLNRPKEGRLSGTYLVLALAILGAIVLGAFETLVSFYKLNMGGSYTVYIFGMIVPLLIVIQVILQALVIYFGQRRRPSKHHRYSGTIQGLLSYLAMFNLVSWFLNSFVMVEYMTVKYDVTAVTSEAWHIIVHLCLPPVIYFRFISSLMILRVKRLFKEQEQPELDTMSTVTNQS